MRCKLISMHNEPLHPKRMQILGCLPRRKRVELRGNLKVRWWSKSATSIHDRQPMIRTKIYIPIVLQEAKRQLDNGTIEVLTSQPPIHFRNLMTSLDLHKR